MIDKTSKLIDNTAHITKQMMADVDTQDTIFVNIR